MKNGNDLVGKKVTIKCKESMYNGAWGVIKHFDGEYYHIAMWNGNEELLVFERNEFKVERQA